MLYVQIEMSSTLIVLYSYAYIVIYSIPDGLVMTGLLSFTLVTVTEIVAVPVRGGAALSTAITCTKT